MANSLKTHGLRPLSIIPPTPQEGKDLKYPPSLTAFKATVVTPFNLINLKDLGDQRWQCELMNDLPQGSVPDAIARANGNSLFFPSPSIADHDT